MPKERPLPALRRETVLPSGSFEPRTFSAMLKDERAIIHWKRLPGRGRIAGVCAGLAYRFSMRPWKVRLAFVLATFLLFLVPVVFYVLAATFVRPRRRLPRDFDRRTA